MSEVTFTQISNSSFDVSSYYAGISTSFGISWSQVVYDNLTIPMYSALARRLHVGYLQAFSSTPTLDTLTNQVSVIKNVCVARILDSQKIRILKDSKGVESGRKREEQGLKDS